MKHKFHIRIFLTLLGCLFFHFSFSLDTNTQYFIFHYSGMALSSADGVPNLHTFEASKSQTFQFIQTGSYYLIKSLNNGKFISKKETWNTEYSSTPSNASKFSIEECSGEFVKFKCADNNLYIGTDQIVAGSDVYSDKNGKESFHFWIIKDASNGDLITNGLECSIQKAETKLKTTKEGDKEGEYSHSTRLLLQKEIDNAKNILRNSNSQQEIINEAKTLNQAINDYSNKRNAAFSTGTRYYIMHASNRYLSKEGSNVQIKDKRNSEDQQFEFEKIKDGIYAIKNVASGLYLNATGEYSVNFTTTNTSNTSQFKINYAPNEDLYVRIQFSSNNKYLGTDGTSDAKGVYSDKDGTDGKHYWHLIRADKGSETSYSSFHIGSPALRMGMNWLDVDGKHINAHGGCVLYENGTYYWFGENYRPSPVKSNGIVCYSSKDLYNWKLEGMAYKCPEVALRSDYQDMNYGRTLERPKVMFCPNTGKYVMWVHWENGSGYAASRVAILYSDKITGPYTFLKTMRPRGDEQPSGSRDQTLMFDPDYNVGYHFGSAEENMTMHGTLLTDNFLDLSNNWERMFIKKQYEAPAIFKYHNKFIAITSGCTGWDPNPAHSSSSMLPLSGWEDLGNPCVDNEKSTTYHSQSNYIFKLPNKYDAYIYMGDRWKGGDYFNDANVGESWHIWLPVDMRAGYPIIRFYQEWDLSLFDKINRYRRTEKFENGNTYLLLSKNSNKIVSSTNDGRLFLSEDNDQTNLSFKVSSTNNGYYILTTEEGLVLSYDNKDLTLLDSTGTDNQQWRITSSNTNDGYFYISPKENERIALGNFGASTTNDGIVGLTELKSDPSCQFAFCFDSQKHQYSTITDESDGSYKKWIESKGYEATTGTNEIFSYNKTKDEELSLLIYREENGNTLLHSLKKQQVMIFNMEGVLIHKLDLGENEIVSLHLSVGSYSINGFRWLQK